MVEPEEGDGDRVAPGDLRGWDRDRDWDWDWDRDRPLVPGRDPESPLCDPCGATRGVAEETTLPAPSRLTIDLVALVPVV